jgi:hypothetical protein
MGGGKQQQMVSEQFQVLISTTDDNQSPAFSSLRNNYLFTDHPRIHPQSQPRGRRETRFEGTKIIGVVMVKRAIDTHIFSCNK